FKDSFISLDDGHDEDYDIKQDEAMTSEKETKPKLKRKFISLQQKIDILDQLSNGKKLTAIAKDLELNESSIRTVKQNESKIRSAVMSRSLQTLNDPDSDELNITLKNRKAKVKQKMEKTRSRQRTKQDAKKTKSLGTKEKKGEATFKLQAKDYKWDDETVCCCHCGKRYGKMSSLRFHVKTKHYKIPKYRCPECLEEFMTVPQFTVHKLEVHNIDHRKRDCFKQHYRQVHLKQRPKLIGCYYCEEKVSPHMRAYHLEKAHGVPAPSCGACGKKFPYPFQVLRHQKTYHMGEKKFVCNVCDMTFASRGNLVQHQVKHSSLRPFKCDLCEETFKLKKHLSRHRLTHLNQRRS
ncbi:zinc finger protein 449, partial [Danaus plexippus plexippus]